MSLFERLAVDADALGVELDAGCWSRLEALGVLWLHYGESINLLSMRSGNEVQNGVLEALAGVSLARRLRVEGRWLDVGSGGGFPGLVVAACCEFPVTLVEPRARRASFLERALGKIGRRRCRVVRARLGDRGLWTPLGGDSAPQGPFEVVDSRAFAAPGRWLELAAHLPTRWVLVHERLGNADPEGWRREDEACTSVGCVRAYSARSVRST